MSRYVDLNGLTWDGSPISSKIQEVKTKHGYMQGITVGWLWGDNVPHFDLEEHDAKVRADAIDEFAEDMLNEIVFEEKWLFDCKSNNADTNIMISALKTFVKSLAEKLKEQK